MNLRVLFLLAACLAFSAAASAQDRPLSEAGPLGLPVPLRSVMTYCRDLGFGSEQTKLARELHRGYSAAYREATTRARGTVEPLEGRHERVVIADAYVIEVRDLEQQFLRDLRALCSPDQSERFESVERARRRERGRILAFCAGDGVDLTRVFESLKLERSEAADEILLRWELDIDRVEADRDRLLRGVLKMLAEPAVASGQDRKPLQDFISNLHAVSTRARDLTRRSVRELGGVLAPDARTAFTAEFNRRCYPRIYADSDAERALAAAAKIPDFTPDQREQLEQLTASYSRDSGPMNDRWARAVDEKQAALAEDLEAADLPDDPQDPFVSAKSERLALDERTLRRLGDILTVAQRDLLPKPSRRNDGPPEFVPDMGESYQEEWERFERED